MPTIPNSEKWKDKLTPEQYDVLFQCSTEPPFTGALLNEKRKGMFVCAACGTELFSSDTKYDSHSGWPSFWDAVDPAKVEILEDDTFGMQRLEVRCATCGGHLGHVFDDGPRDKTGKRYCINSASLNFKPADHTELPVEISQG